MIECVLAVSHIADAIPFETDYPAWDEKWNTVAQALDDDQLPLPAKCVCVRARARACVRVCVCLHASALRAKRHPCDESCFCCPCLPLTDAPFLQHVYAIPNTRSGRLGTAAGASDCVNKSAKAYKQFVGRGCLVEGEAWQRKFGSECPWRGSMDPRIFSSVELLSLSKLAQPYSLHIGLRYHHAQ